MEMIKIFYINTFTFAVPCVKIQFNGPSREISRLLRNRLNNVSVKLEISNVNIGLKKYFVFFSEKVFIVSLWLTQSTCKTSTVSFRARCKLEVQLYCRLVIIVTTFVA